MRSYTSEFSHTIPHPSLFFENSIKLSNECRKTTSVGYKDVPGELFIHFSWFNSRWEGG